MSAREKFFDVNLLLIPSTTLIFRCRFRSVDDLEAYSTHPDYVRLAAITQLILEDDLVADWISNGISDSPKPRSVIEVRRGFGYL